MHRPNHWTDDAERGSAAVEFILLGVLMLVPLVYLVVALGAIQEQSLGAEAGARHIARAVATAQGRDDAARRTRLVLDSVVEEYGLDPGEASVEFSCRPASAACPAPGATLVVTVRTRVTLPLVPSVLGVDEVARIPLEATSLQKVSRRWGGG
ncbi:TadE/TadG family type IV pilus assembly protein [Microbacterium sp. NPDC057407]|uniref:TadE/TadG family type IV pilus assembly protein n=1 Tax=Microbacterium sp. NPDC057407 TaxID=3346120 RepID=UPI0036725EB6